ncbi:DEAD/DEAH box helicase [Patescibacteria group bacterium]|nr:DEAD/DEAH box helicase [Patescibacteria group bacterium]MBU1612990.1 DEAD/DEAH box helicase [Patescibacteria group bacterium]
MTQNNQIVPSFSELGIAPEVLEVLTRLKFTSPTPIQHQCIPAALEGKDIVGIAQTGTGKTLAFGVPMIQLLGQNKGQGLILLPTRELALQVNEVFNKIGQKFGLRTAVLIGGASSHQQVQAIRRRPHVIVSTPGRLIDHLKQKNLSLERVNIVVLDEADRMFDIGFAPQIRQILSFAPQARQTLMFSATMPKAIAEMAARFMKMPWRIEVAPAGTTATKVEQEIFIASKEVRIQLLEKLLADNAGTVLIFSRTKRGAKKIATSVRDMGHTAIEIHSNRSLSQRQSAMAGFKTGKYRVLVATDIAARGIDVEDISLVVNYDMPNNPDDYVHRIGRTARAGSTGKAVSFAGPDERAAIRQIEKLIKKTIPVSALPVLPPRRIVSTGFKVIHAGDQDRGGHRPFRGRSRGFRRR